MIYLDNAATTYPKPEVMYEALDYAQRNLAFNAGRGSYEESKLAHKYIEECREFLCEKANAKSLIFTASATHSLNNIVSGLDLKEGDVVYFSPYDHNAIARTLYENQKKTKFVIKQMELNDDLSINLDKLKMSFLEDKPKVVFATHVSNVTGYILPVEEIGQLAKEVNAEFVVDGAQAFGLVPIDIQSANIDYYVFAGHKTLYGPFGIAGILCKETNPKLKANFYGGTGSDSLNVYMPEEGNLKYEPSSPNVVAIYSLLQSAKWIFNQDALKHEQELYDYTVSKLKELDDVIIYETPENRNTGIISFNVEGFTSTEISKILDDDYGIKVRSDYHCCPYIHDFINAKTFYGTIRVSFSVFSSIKEIDDFTKRIENIVYG